MKKKKISPINHYILEVIHEEKRRFLNDTLKPKTKTYYKK